jgi:transposase, IS5 family
MFKLLLLQWWYGLSDPGFTGFSLSSFLPDHSVTCRFRNALLDLKLYDTLLTEINGQLESKGILVKTSNGAILDATIVQSSRRPRKTIEVMAEDRKEEEQEAQHPSITYSDDTDATWIRKGKKAYYGYKAHIAVEGRDGFFILADKGYRSAKNRALLDRYVDGIMHKAVRNRPLTFLERWVNRIISSIRYKVEQSLGTFKRLYGFSRMRYRGILKGNMELHLIGMAFNLKKATAMVE